MNMNEFMSKIASVTRRGNNIATDVQGLIVVAVEQIKLHKNADYTARLLNGLNGCRLDIRRDVRAYIQEHAPVLITFSKTEGYHAKMKQGDVKELKVPFYEWARPKNDSAEVDANKLIQTVNNLYKKYEDLSKEEKDKVRDVITKKFGFTAKSEPVDENV